MGSQVFWITSRAAGIVALLLSSAAVGVGVSMGGRFLKGRGPDLRVTHEALALSTLFALVVHAASLLGDSYFHPSLATLTVPFAGAYRTPYLAVGIIAGWGMALLGLSYYLRDRIGVARWKVLHRLTALAWLLGLVHTLGTGTDAGRPWFLAMLGVTALPVPGLIAWRLARARGRRPRPGISPRVRAGSA
jgi:methionine sulfoxide reductase heme-binding subunit